MKNMNQHALKHLNRAVQLLSSENMPFKSFGITAQSDGDKEIINLMSDESDEDEPEEPDDEEIINLMSDDESDGHEPVVPSRHSKRCIRSDEHEEEPQTKRCLIKKSKREHFNVGAQVLVNTHGTKDKTLSKWADRDPFHATDNYNRHQNCVYTGEVISKDKLTEKQNKSKKNPGLVAVKVQLPDEDESNAFDDTELFPVEYLYKWADKPTQHPDTLHTSYAKDRQAAERKFMREDAENERKAQKQYFEYLKTVRPQHIRFNDDEASTSTPLTLERTLERALKNAEPQDLPYAAAIGDYRELAQKDKRFQWNACISNTDTDEELALTLTRSKKEYTFRLHFVDSTDTQIDFKMVPTGRKTKSQELINTKALTVTKRSGSAHLGSAEYLELEIENKPVRFERYFELMVGGKLIAIDSTV